VKERKKQECLGGSFSSITCPILQNLECLERKWTLRILREVSAGETKFNKIKKRVKGITASVLARRLRELEQAELLKRIVSNSTPLAVEYTPTEKTHRIFACWFENTS